MRHIFVSVILIIMLCLATVLSGAQEIEKKELAVILPFKAGGVSEKEALVFTDHITAQVYKTGILRVLDRSEQETILNEFEFSLSGCVDESCQLEVGKMLSANLIITGSIGPFGEKYLVNIKLINVETAETINTVSEYYDAMEDMLEDSQNLVLLLLDTDRQFAKATERKIAEKGSSNNPKVGYFSLSGGYSEIYRETEDGLAVTGLPELSGGDTYYTSLSSHGAAEEYTTELFAVTQLLKGF